MKASSTQFIRDCRNRVGRVLFAWTEPTGLYGVMSVNKRSQD